jgi:chromosome segregation ATPase
MRRDRRAQPQPEPPFAVESCECFTEGAFALLRVTGTGSTPATLVGEGESPESFEPLPQPAPAGENDTWRIAFALPAELGVPGTRLWLHDGGVYLVELVVPAADDVPETREAQPELASHAASQPAVEASVVAGATVAVERAVERRAAAEDELPAANEDADDPRARKLIEAWAEAAHLRDKLAAREAELSKALQDLLDARHNVEPLREYAEELTIELAGVRKELKKSQAQGRRAKELESELAAVKAKLENAEPGLAEAERATKSAEREAVAARDEVVRLERELTSARLAVENAIRNAKSELEEARREAAAAHDRLSAEAQEQQQTADELRTKLTKAEDSKSRRRGVGRRTDDRELQKVRAEHEKQITAREQRIRQLEEEAESFTQRRVAAMTESLRARVDELEEEVRQHTTCNEDLRSLLESERELVGAARGEVHELKRQLASAQASRVAEAVDHGDAIVALPQKVVATKTTTDPPPWSALDDELLARIEKAKSLTG